MLKSITKTAKIKNMTKVDKNMQKS